MFVTLERDWVGRTVVLIGGGPSAKHQPLERLEHSGHIVVAINDAMVHLPWADVAFSIDMVWMGNRIAELNAFRGEKLMAVPRGSAPFADERQIIRIPGVGFGQRMDHLFTGGNSGYAALGMALLRGADRIVLVGYDMKQHGHWHAGYTWHSRPVQGTYPRWVRGFWTLAKRARESGQAVYNTNAESAITCFTFAPIEDFLEVPA
jgi:hypothetical protein